VYPALSVIAAIGERAEVLWVGGEGGMEESLVPRAGVPFQTVPAAGLHGVGWRTLPRNLWKLGRGVLAARAIVRSFAPDVMFLTGGYVGVPAALAGWAVPKLVYIPDIEPGKATRLLMRGAQVVAVTCAASKAYLPARKRIVVSGYPTRPELLPTDRDQARRALGLARNRAVLLVLGGSRGARSINEALWDVLPSLLEHMQVLHVTGELGEAKGQDVRQSLPAELRESYRPIAYLHHDMGTWLSAADLALSRAGASVLGEYPLFGLPSLLVPYPYAWRYQIVNATYLVEQGAALMLEDHALDRALEPIVLELMRDKQRLRNMAEAARKLATPLAAQVIADELVHLAEAKDGRHA
jgi:undecaprenyldiphospho-muramoylpentapeptide beta-N-acetylglucosaminyltransferase